MLGVVNVGAKVAGSLVVMEFAKKSVGRVISEELHTVSHKTSNEYRVNCIVPLRIVKIAPSADRDV